MRVVFKMNADAENPFVYFDIEIEKEYVGRISFELRKDIVPRACENFQLLCTGERIDNINVKKLTFKGTAIHSIYPGVYCQGGDVISKDGSGGESVYGETFEDENFKLAHAGRGVLSMVNSGLNSNESQFFLTFDECPLLDKRHVVFGYVCDGMDVLRKIENVGTPVTGVPSRSVIIRDCGQYY